MTSKSEQPHKGWLALGLTRTASDEADKLLAAYKRGEQWAVDEVLAIRARPSAMLFD